MENLVIYVGHNNIDSGNSGFETANILMDSESGIKKELPPLKVALCRILPVKSGLFW